MTKNKDLELAEELAKNIAGASRKYVVGRCVSLIKDVRDETLKVLSENEIRQAAQAHAAAYPDKGERAPQRLGFLAGVYWAIRALKGDRD